MLSLCLLPWTASNQHLHRPSLPRICKFLRFARFTSRCAAETKHSQFSLEGKRSRCPNTACLGMCFQPSGRELSSSVQLLLSTTTMPEGCLQKARKLSSNSDVGHATLFHKSQLQRLCIAVLAMCVSLCVSLLN